MRAIIYRSVKTFHVSRHDMYVLVRHYRFLELTMNGYEAQLSFLERRSRVMGFDPVPHVHWRTHYHTLKYHFRDLLKPEASHYSSGC